MIPINRLSGSSWFGRALNAAGITACLLAAIYYAGSTAIAVWHYGWTELFQDQFRQYTQLLSREFPHSVLMPDNSHRQITSNFVRLADLHWRGADQDIGVALGLLMLLVTLAATVTCIVRDRALPLLFRVSGVLLATIGLMWMGSARMQFHGNESFQIYLVMTCALVVAACVESLRRSPNWAVALIALLAAATALISFATGVAVSGLLVALLVLRKVEWRWTAVLSAVAIFGVYAYMFLLPGSEGVRNVISLAVLDVGRNAATFLASFWMTGWLSYADQGVAGVDAASMGTASLGDMVVVTARAVFAMSGQPRLLDLAFAIGIFGLLLLAWCAWRSWRHADDVGRSESLGLALAIFAAGVAVLVALGRSTMFVHLPDQVLADRYVPWSALFWLGLMLAIGARIARQRWGAAVFAVSIMMLAILFYPSHRFGYGWASAVEHEIERRAAQIASGVYADGLLSFTDMEELAHVQEAVAALRTHRVAMFRNERNHLPGRKLHGLPEMQAPAAHVGDTEQVVELMQNPLSAWHVEGRLSDAHLRGEISGLIVVDPDNRVLGVGEFGFRTARGSWQRIDDMADGFDVYLRAEPPCAKLRLYGVDDDARRFVPLTYLNDCALPEEIP